MKLFVKAMTTLKFAFIYIHIYAVNNREIRKESVGLKTYTAL